MEGGSHEDAVNEIELRKAQHHARSASPADEDNKDADAGFRQARRLEHTVSLRSTVSKQSHNSQSEGETCTSGEGGVGEGRSGEAGAGEEKFVPTTCGVLSALCGGSVSPDMASHLKTIRNKRYCPLISSTGTFRSCWDITSLFMVLYCTFSVPYEMCFNPPNSPTASAVNMTVEAFFIVEIFMNFFTTYLDEDGIEIMHPLFIATNYCRCWLMIDLISSIPSEMVERVYEASRSGDEQGDFTVLAQLRIIRILRLTKLLRLLRIKQLMEDIELKVPAMRTVFGLFRLLFMMFILAHVQACVFFAVAKENIGNSWVSKYHFGCCENNLNFVTGKMQMEMEELGEIDPCFSPADLPSLEVLYTNAIYWSFTTLTSVGYGDITPCNEYEMIWCACAMLIGSGMFAFIVGNISEVVTAVAGQKIELKRRMRELQDYILTRKLPKEISVPLRQQCLHRWRKVVFSENQVLEDFTPQTRREVVSYVNAGALKKISFLNELLSNEDEDFKQIAEEFQIFLATKLRPLVVPKNEDVVNFADEGGDMFIVMLGTCVVYSGTTNRILEDHQGTECINELGLISQLVKGLNLSEEEQAYFEDNLPAQFADILVSDLLPLQQTKTFRAHTELEGLQLQIADFREAVDRTNNKKGESLLRFELVRIFLKMLEALSDRDSKILVSKTKAKRARRDKAERMKRLQKTIMDAAHNTKRSTRRCDVSQEDVQELLDTVKAVNAKMEAQELELKNYMQSIGLVPPEAPIVNDSEAPIISTAEA